MTNAKNKSQNTPKEITQSQLIQAVSDANKTGSCVKYGFILGAGASVNSNIPTGDWFAKKWFEEIKTSIGEDALKTWTESTKDFDDKNLAASYTKLFDKRFEVNYTLGYQELQHHMDKAKPSIGYSFLAQVLAKTANKFVITTNFDTMTEDALFDLKDAKPLVLGHELLSGFINANSPTRPTIVKIHRDFLFDPYNSDSQVEEMDTQWQKALAPVLQENAMIVIGYGGNDESLMGYLEAIETRKPIYWCCRDINRISDRIKQLLNKNDFVIKIESFDKFMLLLSDKLGFNSLIDREDIHNSEIVKSAVARAQSHLDQIVKLREQDNLGEEVKAALEKLLPSWWEYELAVEQEADNNKKDKIYCEGLDAYPKSYELMNNYANFLWRSRKDYDQAEIHYQKALKLKPDDGELNGNYASFLHYGHKCYGQAEIFYLKALELELDNVNNMGNYTNFLTDVRKDYDLAEKFYLKVLDLEPDNSTNAGGYAIFLTYVRKDYDQAEKFYLKSLELDPDNANNTCNYAIFLTDVRKDYDQAEKFYLKSLELDPDNANNTCNYANFLTGVRKDYDRSESFYLKALGLEPDNANNAGWYANFLKNIRKDYDQAKIFYLKALELEPDNANNSGNYASFLHYDHKDYDQAERFYLKALELDPDDSNNAGIYANFLKNIRKDYDQAERFYLKALELGPDNANNAGNYAIFLIDVRKDYDQAERFYLKALELDHDDANKTGSYANFLKNIRKDDDKAETFYQKALELEPEDAGLNGNYAQLLLERGEKTKASSYLETAFKNIKEENDLTLELWFYRLAHFPEFYDEAKNKLDQLLADGHRSIGWNFEGNILQAEKEGFQDIDLLKRYAKKITEE